MLISTYDLLRPNLNFILLYHCFACNLHILFLYSQCIFLAENKSVYNKQCLLFLLFLPVYLTARTRNFGRAEPARAYASNEISNFRTEYPGILLFPFTP